MLHNEGWITPLQVKSTHSLNRTFIGKRYTTAIEHKCAIQIK